MKGQWGERGREVRNPNNFLRRVWEAVRGMDHGLKPHMKGIKLMVKCKDLEELSEVH